MPGKAGCEGTRMVNTYPARFFTTLVFDVTEVIVNMVGALTADTLQALGQTDPMFFQTRDTLQH